MGNPMKVLPPSPLIIMAARSKQVLLLVMDSFKHPVILGLPELWEH